MNNFVSNEDAEMISETLLKKLVDDTGQTEFAVEPLYRHIGSEQWICAIGPEGNRIYFLLDVA